MSATVATETAEYKGYRGPRRLMTAAVVTFILGGATAVAAFVIVQIQGVTSSAGGAVIELFLGSGGADGAQSSTILVAVFIVGFVLAVAGLAAFVFSAVWMIVRVRLGHRAAKGWDRARPVLRDVGERGQSTVRTARPRIGSLLSRRGRGALGTAPAPAAALVATPVADPSPAMPGGSQVSGLTYGDPLAPGVVD